jgi:DNA polymerase-3 subunit chi
MGDAFFYHLTRSSLDTVVPDLLTKSLSRGWRVVVRGTDPQRMNWLDERLWLGVEDGFLPHGQSGGPHDADQPVLLTCASDMVNAPACLMSVDGAEVAAQEVTAMDRVCVLFDGNQDEILNRARGQWRTLTAAGCKAQYWSEESGRWEKRFET